MQIKQQSQKLSCGPCCISMALDYFEIEHTYTEETLITTCGVTSRKGTSPKKLYRTITSLFPDTFEINIFEYGTFDDFGKSNTPDTIDVCLTMYERAKNPNHPEDLEVHPYGMHYIIVNHQGREAKTYNPFGFEQDIHIENVWDRMSMHKQYLRWQEKILLFFGVIQPYTWIRIKKLF